MAIQYCPSCGSLACPPSGKSKDVLILGEFPGDYEMQVLKPFASSTRFVTAGQVLRKELEMIGYSLNQFRVCNLWFHKPNDNEECYKAGFENALTEASGKKAVLLVGSDVVSAFTSYKVSDVNGLQVDSAILSAPIIYAMYNPALALHRSVGEIRFAISKFVERLEREEIL